MQKGGPSQKRVSKEQEINKARRAGETIETEKKCMTDTSACTSIRLTFCSGQYLFCCFPILLNNRACSPHFGELFHSDSKD